MGSTRSRPDPQAPRDRENWARPVPHLRVRTMPLEAVNLNVEGRQIAGPLQGFGPLWQKTYRVRLSGASVTPAEVIAAWKANFESFWPANNRFFGPITGIAPGEVAVLNLEAPGGMRLSTGVMIVYVDDVSFAFMTPKGHMFSSLITFSAHEEDGVTVAEVEPLLRTSDPLWEIVMRAYGFRAEDRFWQHTLRSLAAHFDVKAEPTVKAVMLDRHIQWSQAKNIWHNAAIRSALYALSTPLRWFRRRGSAPADTLPGLQAATPAEPSPADVAAARDAENWARASRLRTGVVPPGAKNQNVEGREVVGALQGFGQLWQKTYRLRLNPIAATPEEVMTVWKANFARFQPPGNHFYPPLSGIKPGEVMLIDTLLPAVPGLPGMIPMASGVMVVYEDEESFAVMTPHGFPEAGWNTFAVLEDEDGLVAQIQSTCRAADPIYEFGFRFMGGSRHQERTWRHVLAALAAHYGVDAPAIEMRKECIDPRLQWSRAGNIWHNAGIRSTLYALTAPLRYAGRVRGRSG